MTDDVNERVWETGWDGHLQAQMRRMAMLPLWEKIAWLEEAQRIAATLTAQRAAERTQGQESRGRP